jgi:alcohol dehydrogenase class IV
LTGLADSCPEDALEAVASLVADVGSVPLADYGVQPTHFDELVTKALNSSSMKGNPISLTRDEVAQILAAAL